MQEKIKDDTISRQAAIDAITEYGSGDTIYMSVGELRRRIEHLPSVQAEPCEDAVRREDVQSIAEKSDWFESSDSFNDFMWALYALPSVQPDRMKLVQQAVNTIMSTSRSYSIRDRAFRNAARLVQCAIDGEAPDFEQIPEGDETPSESKWIPVTKRLPEETEARYWVCTDGGYQCQCRWTNDVFGLGEGDTWTWKIFDIPQYSKVIAWMPLPEPYVERRTDETD